MKTCILLLVVLLIGAVWATNPSEQKAKSNSNHPIETEAAGSVQLFEAPMLQNFFDDFEAYTSGTQLTIQNSTDWTTWSGGTGTVEDPFVTNAQAYSGSNSVVIAQNNNLVKIFAASPITTGTWVLSWKMYIASGQAGYFNTLADFAGSSSTYAMQAYFNVGGGGTLDAGGTSAATFNYSYNTWMPVEVLVNLDNDMAEFWLNGSMIYSWQYTLGAFGTTIPKQLDANNFFGATANDEMYFDDYSVSTCTAGVLGDVNGDGFTNSTDALIIQSYDAGIPVPQPLLDRINLGFADTNDDGLTNSTDALLVLSFDASIPVPFPIGDPVCL